MNSRKDGPNLDFDLDDAMGEISDMKSDANNAIEAINTAESCETHVDFVGNLDEAIGFAESLLKGLRAIKKDINK